MQDLSPKPIENGLQIFTSKDCFKILQITDLHLAERYVLKVSQLRRLRKIIDQIQPDLIVNTGDFFCRRRIFPPRFIVRLFNAIIGKDYPWTFAWGNHDCEAFRRGLWFTRDDWKEAFCKFEHFLAHTHNCLYVPSTDFMEHWELLSPEEVEREKEALMLPVKNGKGKECFDGFYGGNF
ncbi:MAG: metallophosphoesterase, partial [Spirochaetales bacterium]